MDLGSDMKNQGIFDIPLSEVGKTAVPKDKNADKTKVKQYRETKRTARS